MSETKELPVIDALKALLFANKLFEQPDHIHDPDTEWEKAMDMAEKVLAAPVDQLNSSSAARSLTVRKKICNCAGAVGQAQGFLQGVSTCEQLLPHQRGAAEQFAKELESRWDALSAELEQLLSQQASPPQEPGQ